MLPVTHTLLLAPGDLRLTAFTAPLFQGVRGVSAALFQVIGASHAVAGSSQPPPPLLPSCCLSKTTSTTVPLSVSQFRAVCL